MDRKEISDILDECGTLLELKGENPFRANAYHNASRAIQQLEGNVAEMLADGSLAKIKGLGQTMIEKIEEMLSTGKLSFYDKLRGEIPPGLVDMLRLSGFGPKRIKQVYADLGIDSIELLKAACEDGRIAGLKGFGQKSATKLLESIQFLETSGQRLMLPIALQLAERLRDALAKQAGVKRIEICGSLRRRKETIGDIDLLVASDDAAPIMKIFVEHPDIMQVIGHGPTKSSVLLKNGINADLRVVTDEQFPFALHYFTGSKEHNVAMRARAQEFGLKLNEYELAGPKGSVKCKEESDIFKALGLDYIPPELREDTGEIDAALVHRLPALLELGDITGFFHCHTNASDGVDTLEEMVSDCRKRGYKYLGIADHSKSAFYANGLSVERIRQQHEQIDKLNKKHKDFRIFKGIESDILADGSLDYDDDVLATFDYVVASIHQPMNMSEKQMTERVIRAIRHPLCTMLGHPTGRLLLRRDPFPIDMEAVLKEAALCGTMIEINSSPYRLDLDWIFCKRAKALGVTLVINPDAHSTHDYDNIPCGVATARRGWLTKENVFNTLGVKEIVKRFESMKQR